jgi:type IV pilus assembly protein PilZ
MDALSHAHSLSVAIADKFALHASYMPFIKDGAIFVPTSQHFSLHDEVTLQLRLVEEGKKLLVPGRVVWISAGMGHRGTSAGIGLQFTGEHRVRIRQFVEDILGELAKQPASNPAY